MLTMLITPGDLYLTFCGPEAIQMGLNLLSHCDLVVIPASAASAVRPEAVGRAVGPLMLPWLMLHAGYHALSIRLAGQLPGDFSSGIYLYAFPVQQLLLQFTPNVKWTVWGFTLAATGLTVPLAIASWYGVEVRWLGKASRTT